MANATFDPHAAGYDTIAESALGVALRARVHAVIVRHLHEHATVLDLGCGSGIDAAWLAPQVRSVLAIDPSAEMVAQARARCATAGNVTVAQGSANELSQLVNEPVDLVVANFGVINCVGDLGDFAHRLHPLVASGGRLVAVSMARWCPIELGIGIGRRNRALVTRRSAQPTDAGASYQGLDIRYASAAQLAQAFTPGFALTHAESLGLTLPPFEQRHWVEGRPRLRQALATTDRRIGRLGAKSGLGDHHIAVLTRTS